MVRAILDGRKTQTRRVAKLLLPGDKNYIHADDSAEWASKRATQCPFGAFGDRLWVRETWRTFAGFDDVPPRDIPRGAEISYLEREDQAGVPHLGKVRQSIFMPRWMSRITLEITEVRVQRLQEISEEDALAEGLTAPMFPSDVGPATYAFAYRHLWDAINGAGSWENNPWVWCVSFKRIL